MYYEQDVNQGEIAERLGVSRSTISRMLADAREMGVVRIRIVHPAERQLHLENQLESRFGLQAARVVAGSSDQLVAREDISLVASDYLDELLEDGMTVAISNGRSISRMVNTIAPRHPRAIVAAQMIGSIGRQNPMIDGPEVARQLARAYGGVFRAVHAPLLAETEAAREVFLSDPSVRETLDLAANAHIALIGIGEMGAPGPIFAGLISHEDLADLRNRDAVGHTCAQFYDAAGRSVEHSVNRRAVAISFEALRRIPIVIAVAAGADKAIAIRGALTGGLITALITDAAAARAILGSPARPARNQTER